MMKLDQLQYFVTVADTQHIGKAAKTLGISASAISHSVRKLEEDLGQKLFSKAGKNISLTDFGQRVSVRARELLNRAEDMRAEFRSAELPVEGCVRVGATHGISDLLLAPLLGTLQKKHPRLVFEIYSLRSAQVLESVANGTLDLGICFSPQAHPSIAVSYQQNLPMKIAVKPNHRLLRTKGAVSGKEISSYPAASPQAFAGIEVCENHPSLKKAGISSDPALIFDSYEVAANYLKNTDAWCLMPESLIEPLKLKAVKVEKFQAEATMALIHPKSRQPLAVLLEAIGSLFV
jgi:DNA-binding transcriptional LysR family regulator